MSKSLTNSDLEERLREAEEIIDTLRSHKVDAVIGTDRIAMLRLKQLEDQLQEQIQISANRLKEIESIYQNVPVGLCILDRNLKFTRVNNHLAKIHGIPAEEHIGRKMSELLPKLAGSIEPDLRRVINSGKAQMNVELCGETPDKPGIERCLLEHWLPLHNKQGQVVGINMVIDEITERKKYEEKLHQLNATLEERVAERTKVAEERADKLREMALEMTNVEEKERQRLARVLHDGLQQLLTGAKLHASLIRNRLSGQTEAVEQVDKLNQILDRSVEASRSLAYELNPPILHDHGLLAAVQSLADMPHMQGLKINIHADDEIPSLSQNLKVFFFQAIRELLNNVIKHANVNKAEVCLTNDEEKFCIEVIDQGDGFDADNMKMGASTSQGLRNIRKKLNLMNGQLKVDSEPGRGSHFILSVPIDENRSTTGEATHKAPDKKNNRTEKRIDPTSSKSPGQIKVLVVDDHQVMRNGLVKLLSQESDIKIVGEASNGLEAVDFVHSFQPQAIIMDVSLPKMDGIEATRLIHQEFPDIKIIGLSMHEESEYSLKMKEAGAVDLLNKGGPAEKLFEAIRSVNLDKR